MKLIAPESVGLDEDDTILELEALPTPIGVSSRSTRDAWNDRMMAKMERRFWDLKW